MMTLSNNNLDEHLTTTNVFDGTSSNWSALYCSHLWSNSNLRRAIINGSENKMIKHCYTCKGKIRKYELRSPIDTFVPNNHSTPNKAIIEDINNSTVNQQTDEPRQVNTNVDVDSHIPSISYQVDTSFRQKYTSHDMRTNDVGQRRLRKSLKGIGCIVNLALNESPVKKRTQIQACSISVMIVAIIVICLVLVNFTSLNYTRATNTISTSVVPTHFIDFNKTSSITTLSYKKSPTPLGDITTVNNLPPDTTTMISPISSSTLSNVLSRIRDNIKTFPKESKKKTDSQKPKEKINRDLSVRFCSCQTNEVCMLDENSGTAVCRKPLDLDDPTGCGGLCALETEACQLVDRARGVRVCRLLSLVTCSTQEWRCRNGLCVAAEDRCDGSIQCYDRSDEMHCECDLTRQFRCGHSISCFPNSKLCDGVIDCWDGLDEYNCTEKCPDNQFTCTSGQCILTSRFCDGFVDCTDNSDEPQGCDGDCGIHEMRCQNHRCIPKSNICNGNNDCGDNSDEIQCS